MPTGSGPKLMGPLCFRVEEGICRRTSVRNHGRVPGTGQRSAIPVCHVATRNTWGHAGTAYPVDLSLPFTDNGVPARLNNGTILTFPVGHLLQLRRR